MKNKRLTYEQRMDKEIAQVVELMKRDFPAAVDWAAIEGHLPANGDEYFILDDNDNWIATISAKRLTGYWNDIEGV
jgi:hypothetical protein